MIEHTCIKYVHYTLLLSCTCMYVMQELEEEIIGLRQEIEESQNNVSALEEELADTHVCYVYYLCP